MNHADTDFNIRGHIGLCRSSIGVTGDMDIRVFPKIRGTMFGGPVIRAIVFRGLYWGLPFWKTRKLPYMASRSYNSISAEPPDLPSRNG